MSGDTVGERARNNITEIVTLLVTATWLSLLFLGPGNLWLVVLIVGYAAVIPLVETLFGDEAEDEDAGVVEDAWSWDEESDESTTTDDAKPDPLDELRRRYAQGELTDQQFERKVERLLETETIEDVEDAYDHPTRTESDTGRSPNRSSERERERERE
jgi:uncharacterized membrane protein